MRRRTIPLFISLCLLLLSACGAGDTTLPTSSAASIPSSIAETSYQQPESEPEPEPEDTGLIGSVQVIPPEIAESMIGNSWKEDAPVALSELSYITVPFVDFEGEERMGEIIAHSAVAEELLEIFTELYEARFPIAGIALIEEYEADDMLSMEANNSYCFCSRLILGTNSYSVHSYGSAIDINPVQNPYITGGVAYPEASNEYLDRDDVRPGMIVEGDLCYNAFTSRGWSWGGHWSNPDYQHFQKEIV